MNQVNLTFFDLPILASSGAVTFDIWEPWNDYTDATYGIEMTFPAGGFGFAGTWYAANSPDGIIAEEPFTSYSAGTVGYDLSINALSDLNAGFTGTWYAPWFPHGGFAYDEFGTIAVSAGTSAGDGEIMTSPGFDDETGHLWVFSGTGGTWALSETVSALEPVMLLDSGSIWDAVGAHGTELWDWPDSSANANDWHAISSGVRPRLDRTTALNGHPTVEFGYGGSETNYFRIASGFIPNNGWVEMFSVVKCFYDPGDATYRGGWGQFTYQGAAYTPYTNSNVYINTWTNSRIAANPTQDLTQWQIWHIGNDGLTKFIRLNDTPFYSVTTGYVFSVTSSLGYFYLGIGTDGTIYPWRGWIAYVAIFDRQLSRAERSEQITYLRERFGL